MAPGFCLDKALILERLDGDEELLVTMSDIFVQESESYCRNLDQALLANDLVGLRREAHTIKSLLATFADGAGTALALALEQQAKAEQGEGLVDKVEELKVRLRLVVAVVRQELGLG